MPITYVPKIYTLPTTSWWKSLTMRYTLLTELINYVGVGKQIEEIHGRIRWGTEGDTHLIRLRIDTERRLHLKIPEKCDWREDWIVESIYALPVEEIITYPASKALKNVTKVPMFEQKLIDHWKTGKC